MFEGKVFIINKKKTSRSIRNRIESASVRGSSVDGRVVLKMAKDCSD